MKLGSAGDSHVDDHHGHVQLFMIIISMFMIIMIIDQVHDNHRHGHDLINVYDALVVLGSQHHCDNDTCDNVNSDDIDNYHDKHRDTLYCNIDYD